MAVERQRWRGLDWCVGTQQMLPPRAAGGGGTGRGGGLAGGGTWGDRRRVKALEGGGREREGGDGILFSEFIGTDGQEVMDGGKTDETKVDSETGVEDVMDALIERSAKLLKEAHEALDVVRRREPVPEPTSMAGGRSGVVMSPGKSSRPSFLHGVSRGGGYSEAHDRGGYNGGTSDTPALSTGPSVAGKLDGWFWGKVDAGPAVMKPQKVSPRMTHGGPKVLEMERHRPGVLEFMPPEAPSESAKTSIFPESLAFRFVSEEEEQGVLLGDEDVNTVYQDAGQVNAQPGMAAASDTKMQSDHQQGEEFGPNGYWHRWTEIHGKNEDGTITWTEKWWEISDWAGMKEMGAEKFGVNDKGDAWRETWCEKIGFDQMSRQPTVHRSAHKWARAGTEREWEEKWSEEYWSGGKTEKWAEKWGKDGGDVWHEKWGESYDGHGGCVKWTDRWAESPDAFGGVSKWGDKWREDFKDGSGQKNGETWSEHGNGDKYQRWWGENHFGDGSVQKYGNSTTGEHWDITETMDTYYNPIPHFGYDLALSHSPQLRNVPVLPRDGDFDLK